MGMLKIHAVAAAEVLSMASEHPGCLVIIGDALARRVAAERRLCLTGTLGVLLEAKKIGLIPSIRPIIDDLIELGFRLHPRTRTALLVLANE
jgi:predicted nucleic acid-binding protein